MDYFRACRAGLMPLILSGKLVEDKPDQVALKA